MRVVRGGQVLWFSRRFKRKECRIKWGFQKITILATLSCASKHGHGYEQENWVTSWVKHVWWDVLPLRGCFSGDHGLSVYHTEELTPAPHKIHNPDREGERERVTFISQSVNESVLSASHSVMSINQSYQPVSQSSQSISLVCQPVSQSC